jgi:hypothetical protein
MPKRILPNQTNTIVPPNQLDNPPIKEKSKNEQISHQFLRQDKHRAPRDRIGTPQPAPHEKLMRSQQMNKSFARIQNSHTPKRQTVPATIWLSPIEKHELQRIADSEKISLSQAGRAFIRKGMQTRLDMQYSSFLEPVIERVIARYLNNRDSRIITLLVRIAYDSGQTRGIVTNILGLMDGIKPDLLREILDGADKSAKSNIMKKTPQVEELINALNKWFFETNREENTKK